MSELSKRKHRRIGPRTEAESKRIEKIAAAHRTPEARARMSKVQQQKFNDPVVGPAIRQRISVGTKQGLAVPEVSEKISRNMVRIWDENTPRRQQASETAKKVFSDPEVDQRRREGFARPETHEKIGKASKGAWDGNTPRRQQTSEWATQL
jgi:hypothetical protein